jgi:hypothetical protein
MVIYPSTYGSTVLLLDLGRFFSFLILYTVGTSPWRSMPLPTHRTTQTQNKPTQTFMPEVGFETTIPAFEQAKTVHALDRSATVIGYNTETGDQYRVHLFCSMRKYFTVASSSSARCLRNCVKHGQKY